MIISEDGKPSCRALYKNLNPSLYGSVSLVGSLRESVIQGVEVGATPLLITPNNSCRGLCFLNLYLQTTGLEVLFPSWRTLNQGTRQEFH